MQVELWMWGALGALVLVCLLVDLVAFHGHPREDDVGGVRGTRRLQTASPGEVASPVRYIFANPYCPSGSPCSAAFTR